MGNDSIQSNKPIVPGSPKAPAPKPKAKAQPKKPVPVGQKKEQPKARNSELDKVWSDICAEPNWIEKAKIYLRFCRDSHSRNPEALESANRLAGL